MVRHWSRDGIHLRNEKNRFVMMSVILQIQAVERMVDQSWQQGPFIGFAVAVLVLLGVFLFFHLKDNRSAQSKFEIALNALNRTVSNFFEKSAERERDAEKRSEATNQLIAEKMGEMGRGLSDMHDTIKKHDWEIGKIKEDVGKLNSSLNK